MLTRTVVEMDFPVGDISSFEHYSFLLSKQANKLNKNVSSNLFELKWKV